MYTKEIVERLALSSTSAQELEELVDCQLLEVRSEALDADVPVSVLRVGRELADCALFIHLDGGAGDRASLVTRRRLIAAMFETSVIPPSIHVSFSGGSNAFYNGAWEPWVTDELPQWVNDHLQTSIERHNLVLTGISGGGHGALKIAFKYPDRFKAVAAMEPVIMPSLEWPGQHTRASWWLLEQSALAVWGEPFPESLLNNHPPNIVDSNADLVRKSGLDIYLEVGDEDLLNLQDGAEFLHRVLWKHDIPHEFHQVRWADHGGKSIDDRFVETMAFLAASLEGGKKQARDIDLSESEQKFVNYVLSGGPISGEPMPDDASQGTAETELAVMEKLWAPLKSVAQSRDPDMERQYGILPDVGG